jgi:hypothetical protein
MQVFDYTYAYVRQYAGKADANRKGTKLLSEYADRGMGKGGSGGYVAAALNVGRITAEDILDAWQEGKDAYQEFIDDCAKLVSNGFRLTIDSTIPNPDAEEQPRGRSLDQLGHDSSDHP